MSDLVHCPVCAATGKRERLHVVTVTRPCAGMVRRTKRCRVCGHREHTVEQPYTPRPFAAAAGGPSAS